VEARDGESAERLISRFRQMVQRDGLLREYKKRRHFISKSQTRRDARARGIRKARKARLAAASHDGATSHQQKGRR
jgi:small subunit ribosomal protein S21